MNHVIALQITEFKRREAPMHMRQELASFNDDSNKPHYCSLNATFDGKLTFEFADKTYEIGWEELFRAVETVHAPQTVIGDISAEGGIGVTELSGRVPGDE